MAKKASVIVNLNLLLLDVTISDFPFGVSSLHVVCGSVLK